MLFACGVGSGLFFFGVGEPVSHYTQRNRHSADSTILDGKLAQYAMNLTLYHWGEHLLIVFFFFSRDFSDYSLRLVMLLHCRNVDWTDELKGRVADDHEIVFLSADWRQNIRLDGWFDRYPFHLRYFAGSLYFVGVRRVTDEFGHRWNHRPGRWAWPGSWSINPLTASSI